MTGNKRLQSLSYYCLYGSLYGLSLLPFPVLYLLSDGVCFVLFRVIGYRKHVVFKNLRRSFPDKSDAEIRQLAGSFYRYLCDLFLEMFKTLSISKAAMLRHCSMDPEALEIFRDLAKNGQSVILVLGHYGNWEWAGNTFSLLCPQPLSVIYHPLTSPAFDRLMYTMRTRFGTGLIEMEQTFREMVKQKGKVTATAFIADQTPQPQRAHWMTFLNQDTPVFMGAETIARKLNYPIVYATVKRQRRGYYRIYAERLVEAPAASGEGVISELHTRRLERDIRDQPEIWLWSHKRWKHSRPLPVT
ncbi:lysophospholipid acyltransferase family protein [Dinghuibacter silviterrae]|uniref:KDO2-lipid IV(A) lauroyltransferase n=1 Tax=Dinghuibacter silviterrae TaxID=1539049 RepID=A0A4R8DQB5_9BACT|nr:lysophospholipid acyltransferase family protein [Dinghuibacter silviterrae]TDX00324.1 KDO2-lipid IV(A) lauroyltransferase [Dinghuibacter silviterrae]